MQVNPASGIVRRDEAFHHRGVRLDDLEALPPLQKRRNLQASRPGLTLLPVRPGLLLTPWSCLLAKDACGIAPTAVCTA